MIESLQFRNMMIKEQSEDAKSKYYNRASTVNNERQSTEQKEDARNTNKRLGSRVSRAGTNKTKSKSKSKSNKSGNSDEALKMHKSMNAIKFPSNVPNSDIVHDNLYNSYEKAILLFEKYVAKGK